MVDIWDEVKYEPSVWDQVEYKKQEPASVQGTAGAYGSGFAGGYGGVAGDIMNLITGGSPTHVPVGLNPNMLKPTQNEPLQGTHELASSIGKEPQNALERITRESGQFGGNEAAFGTALGGPVGAAVGAAHGSASGALYGGLKELGVPDAWALGITAVTTLSPIAGRKLIDAWKSGKDVRKSIQASDIPSAAKAEIIESLPSEPQPPPGGIGVGTEIGAGGESRAISEQTIEKYNQPRAQKLPSPVIQIDTQLPGKEGGQSLIVRVHPEVGESISKEKFKSEAQAGREISGEIKNKFESAKKEMKSAYKEAEGVTESHNDVYPEMAAKNEARIEELERLPKRDPGAELVYQDALALRQIIGTPDGLFEANGRTIMKQADSFSSRVKYDAPYQGVKSMVKSMVKDMNEGVISSLRRAGKDADKVIKADQIYGRFADTFYSDEIAPFLSKDSAKNAESLGKKTLSDQTTYRSVKQAVGSRKLPVINKIDREIVESRMGKYLEAPKANQIKRSGSELVGTKQYNEDLANLSELIGKEKTAEVDNFFRSRQAEHEKISRHQEKIREANKRVETKKITEERVKPKEEKLPKTPEELDKLFKDASSIRELRKKMSDKGLLKEYEQLASEKVKELFKEGQFEGRKLTGEQIKKVINKDHKVLNELLGEELVDDLFKEAEIAGKEELKEARKEHILKKAGKFAGKSTAYAVGGKILSGILGIFF